MSHEINRWKGFVVGAVSGIVGVIAMDYYWKAATAITGSDPREQTQGSGGDSGKAAKQKGALDDISLIGKHHEKGESSTGAMGRIAYSLFAGKEPRSKETKLTLSYLAHWIFSMVAAGAYGVVRGPARIPDLGGGIALGVGLWGLGDELTVPLLGLSDGPTAFPPELHAHGLGAHIVYGLATAATAQLLDKIT